MAKVRSVFQVDTTVGSEEVRADQVTVGDQLVVFRWFEDTRDTGEDGDETYFGYRTKAFALHNLVSYHEIAKEPSDDPF